MYWLSFHVYFIDFLSRNVNLCSIKRPGPEEPRPPGPLKLCLLDLINNPLVSLRPCLFSSLVQPQIYLVFPPQQHPYTVRTSLLTVTTWNPRCKPSPETLPLSEVICGADILSPVVSLCCLTWCFLLWFPQRLIWTKWMVQNALFSPARWIEFILNLSACLLVIVSLIPLLSPASPDAAFR